MFRQLALRQSTIIKSSVAVRHLSQTPARYSVIDTAKEVLQKANKKIGEVAAEGIEVAENATPSASSVSEAASKANKKTGEVLAEGLDKAQKAAPEVDNLSDAASKVNKKTGEVLADGIDKAETTAAHAEHKLRAKKNSSGYKDLQDKGSKVETEQNRPDDAV